jgi:hypothetical protein
MDAAGWARSGSGLVSRTGRSRRIKENIERLLCRGTTWGK